MKMWILALVAGLLLTVEAFAQNTVVSGQILDPAGNKYINATITANFNNPDTKIANWNNFPLTVTTWTTSADSNANFSLNIPDLNSIGPAVGTFYTFRVCSTFYANPVFVGQPANPCFTYTSPACPAVGCITGATISITAALQAVSVSLPIVPTPASLTGNNTFTGSNAFTLLTTFNGGISTTTLAVSNGGSLAGTFTGSPTFSGNPIFSGQPTFQVAPFAAGLFDGINCSTNEASSGYMRLCRADAINWRNNANSADEGIGTGTGDDLQISHAAGVTLTGTAPNIRFGGGSNAFPMWKRSTTVLQARLADDSGDSNITAALGTFSAHIAVDGVTINASSPSPNQILTASSGSAAAWANAPATTQVQQRVIATQSSNTALAASPSSTTVQTKQLTMPSSGCPCSVFVSWGQFAQLGAAGQIIGWVNDATSSMATGLTAAPGSASLLFLGGASWSPNLYANNATPTFSLIESQSAGGGGNNALASSGFGTSGQQNSWMDFVVLTNSN